MHVLPFLKGYNCTVMPGTQPVSPVKPGSGRVSPLLNNWREDTSGSNARLVHLSAISTNKALSRLLQNGDFADATSPEFVHTGSPFAPPLPLGQSSEGSGPSTPMATATSVSPPPTAASESDSPPGSPSRR